MAASQKPKVVRIDHQKRSAKKTVAAQPPRSDEPDDSFPVVGIGASAGGLEAFSALISALTDDTGMAFVALSHLAPSQPSALRDILSRSTSMPVLDISDRQVIQPNTIYVLPPGRDVTIEDMRLVLQPRAPGLLHRPIDLFFRSLADSRRHQAIGVVLSGTATDGTLGVRAIKGAGGITFAQDDSARQTSMPHSAIADGFVDFVLPPLDIGAELVRIGRSPRTLQSAALPRMDGDAQVTDILRVVRRETGVDFTTYKSGTLRRRILRRMILKRTDRLADYAEILRSTPGEVRALHDDLLIGVTSFFRDPESFAALERSAFRRLLEVERNDEPIRVWVLGCSTGEEAYSLAMALTEYAGAAGVPVRLQVFASDVNAAGIEIARAAKYPLDISEDVSAERLQRFFVKIDDHYRVVKSIRDACIFSRHNVLSDPPFSRIDLVSCRNLLMYLEQGSQLQVIGNLHYALKTDGVLWLGLADSIAGRQDLLETLDSQHKVFARRPGSASRPVLPPISPRAPHLEQVSTSARAPLGPVDVLKESDRVLLHRYAPAGVVLSSSMEVLQYRGDVGRYVSPTPGKATLGLTQVLDRQLQVAVVAAIAKAKREGQSVRDENVRLTGPDGNTRLISLEVLPLGGGPDGFLILFDDAAETVPAEEPAPTAAPEGDAQTSLERVTKELTDTRAYLQAVIEDQIGAREDLEAAHEEAQSGNEELQSINEELETSKEEIQSANEELTTLNDELQNRNADLQLTNNDLMNLLASTDLAVVFLGPGLVIRRFTAAAARLLNLRAVDVNRPLNELHVDFQINVHAQVAHTLDTLEVREQRAQNGAGRWFSLRTHPYRTLDNQIDGVVLVFIDIDDAIRTRHYAESVVATVRSPLIVLDERFTVVTANDAFYRMFETSLSRTEGSLFFDLGNRKWDIPSLRRLLEQVLPQNNVVKDFEVVVDAVHGPRTWLLDARRLQQSDGQRPLILLSMEDVTERQHAEGLRHERVTELAAADRNKNEFLAMLAHELRNPLAPIRTAVQVLGTPGIPASAATSSRVIIERQIRNMVRLIDDLLDVARITQGKLTLQLAPLELTSLLRRTLELVQPHIHDRGQRLELSIEAETAYVLGDTTRLEQAFGNLLNNASKFSQHEGLIGVHLYLRPSAHGPEVIVEVSDDGIGIERPVLPHVFELFRQGGISPHNASGLGVGLALVRRIVELHGGQIVVTSAGANQGSQFVVCLPMLADVSPTIDAADRREISTTQPRRILVVDDNIDAAESLTALLRVYGHDAQLVNDGPAALELAPSFRPAVVFLDIQMPGMDGYEVARRLRRLPETADALLIAVTGFGRDEDRAKSREAGFDRHIMKPMDPRVLPELIAQDEGDRRTKREGPGEIG